MRTGCEDDPAPGFRYSRYTGTCDRTWSGCPATAAARLAELGPEIRRVSDQAKGSLLVAMQNALPKVKEVGCLLIEAKRLCRKSGALWEPWVRENCGMSERSAQAYMRIASNWEEIQKAQTSAPLSIDGALTWLARPKSEPPKGQEPGPADPGDEIGGDYANDVADQLGDDQADGIDVTSPELPPPRRDGLPNITPEQRRQLEAKRRRFICKRDRFTKKIILVMAELVSGLVTDVHVGEWNGQDIRDLSEVADQMAASITAIKSALFSQQRSLGPAALSASDNEIGGD
jgi:hypothetical protein